MNQELQKYFFDVVKKRLNPNSIKVLKVLKRNMYLNKEELSLEAGVKRSYLEDVLIELNVLGLTYSDKKNRSIICNLTDFGKEFVGLLIN